MFPIIIAFSVALFESCKDVFGKLSMQTTEGGLESINPYKLALYTHIVGLLVLLIVVYIKPFSWLNITSLYEFDDIFWMSLLSKTPLQITAFLLYMNALRRSEISLVVPLIALTPVFMPISAYFILGKNELPTWGGYLGIALIVFGAYLLNVKKEHTSIYAPILGIIKNPSAKMMLGAALLWSITSNIDKIGTLHSSPTSWIFYTYTALILIMSIILFVFLKKIKKYFSKEPETTTDKTSSALMFVVILTGITNIATELVQMYALTLLASAAYVISIKRCSILLNMLWGKLIFKEANIKERFIGASIMILGVVSIMFLK